MVSGPVGIGGFEEGAASPRPCWLGFFPDPWQRQLLRSRSHWIMLNCCRQSGKSTTTAIVALHQAIYDPGLVLCVSPSLRQSRELFAKVIGFLKGLEPVEPLEEDNKSSCELCNGSRIVSLPGDPDTVRGMLLLGFGYTELRQSW